MNDLIVRALNKHLCKQLEQATISEVY